VVGVTMVFISGRSNNKNYGNKIIGVKGKSNQSWWNGVVISSEGRPILIIRDHPKMDWLFTFQST